jgi:putative aldouronate transport system permease protein
MRRRLTGLLEFDNVFNAVNLTFVTITMLVVLYPLLYIVSCSLSDPVLVANGTVWLWPRGLNIDGYIRVFQDKNILIGYANSLFYTLFGTLVNLALTLTAGYALSKKTLPGRHLIMTYLLITMYFSGGMIPTYLIVKRLGLIDTRLVLIISGAVSIYNVIVSRTFFHSFPAELEAAAAIDGYPIHRVFLSIVLPLSKALIGVMALYYGVAHWNSYFNAMIYIVDDRKKPLQLFLRAILVTEQMSADMAKTGAFDDMRYETEKLKQLLKYSVIVVSSIPVLVVYPFLQKYFEKGALLGSLKG